MQVQLHPIRLQLNAPFTISRGSYTARKSLIVALSNGTYTGYGEAAEHQYYGISQEHLIQAAEALVPKIEAHVFENPQSFYDFLYPNIQSFPFLQCAFDNAAHDLYGQMQGMPCHQLWGLQIQELPKSSYTLSIDTIEKMVEKIQRTSFDIYKIKLGTANDMAIVQALRQHSNAIFRVDANCAWTAKETIKNAQLMKDLGVEFIEQPLKADDWTGMKEVFQHSALPIIADEACVGEADLSKALEHFHGINIKLMKCGGLTPALRMIQKAKKAQVKIMCGCMVESSVGIAAIAQLLPLLDYVDMDGPLFLQNDPAKAAQLQADGSVQLPKSPGLGIQWLS